MSYYIIKNMCEIIEGFPMYEIHLSKGNGQPGVWSKYKNDYLKACPNDRGYLCVDLYKDGKRTHKKLHILVAKHFIDNPDNLPDVDHKNRDKSDCRISNLRWSTKSDNNHNRECKGYSLDKRRKKWQATIRIGGKKKHLGYFSKEEDARQAYIEASKTHFPGVKF